MAQRNSNLWSEAAAGLTALSHSRASGFRWGVVILLTGLWFGCGLTYWLARENTFLDAFYRTISAVAMPDDYFRTDDLMLQIARYAAIATPVVGLLFAFSGQLGRSLAHILNAGARNHVVIAGVSEASLALAMDARKHGDAVIMVADEFSEETALEVRRHGISAYTGDPSSPATLRLAGAARAAHVVAYHANDTVNLKIEAAMRRLMARARRRRPIDVHVSTRSPMLLREVRQMRARELRQRGQAAPDPVDPKPFSLDELAARALLQGELVALLELATQLGQERLHFLLVGFRDSAEAVAVRVLMSVWSTQFAAPRITVLSSDVERDKAAFKARYPQAFSHPDLWSADIEFLNFDWSMEHIDASLLDRIERERGKPTAAVVAAGADTDNIQLALSLKRACNDRFRWPIPIYMKETQSSEFSRQYARGDTTEELDAYLKAFGAEEATSTRANIIEGKLDKGAAIAHARYNANVGASAMSPGQMQAAVRGWTDVLETFRASNRAVADSALVKVWDAGWRPAKKGEKGETAPKVEVNREDKLSQREHDRWMAERLMSGWRAAPDRNDEQMEHDKLVGWGALNEADREADAVQVRASVDIARILYPRGFVQRS